VNLTFRATETYLPQRRRNRLFVFRHSVEVSPSIILINPAKYLQHHILRDRNLPQTNIDNNPFANGQVIMTSSEDSLQKLLSLLSKTASAYNPSLQLKTKI
jgi:hypothetical protein